MKAEICENDGCFFIRLTAADQVEAARLTRMGMNRGGELSFSVDVRQDGQFQAELFTKKSRRASDRVPRK